MPRLVARYPALPFVLTLCGLWLLFFWRFAAPNPVDRWAFADGDFTQQFGLFRDLVYRQLVSGRFPLWADCLLSGYPLHADPQTQLFYLPAWITYGMLRALGWGHFPIEALTAEALLHYLATSLFVYAFLRAEIKRPVAALLGAIVFTYSGYLTGSPVLQTATLETVTWLPLILLCLRQLVVTQRLRFMALAALVTTLAYFAGHPQTFVYVGTVALAYLVFRARTVKIKWMALTQWGIGWAALTVGLAAIQWGPSLQFISLSTRASLPFNEASNGFPFQDLAQFLITGLVSHWQPLYIGILPLALVVVGLRLHRQSAARFWAGLGLIGLLFSFGTKLAIYDAAFWLLPLFKLFRGQEHLSVVVTFSTSMLAAYGADVLLAPASPLARATLGRIRAGFLVLFALGVFLLTTTLVLNTARLFQSGEGDRLAGSVAVLMLFALLTVAVLQARLAWPSARSRWGALLVGVAALNVLATNRGTDAVPPFETYAYNPLLTQIQSDSDFFRVQDDFQLPGHSGCGYGFRLVDGITPYRIANYEKFLAQAPEPVKWQLLGVRYLVTWRQELFAPDGNRLNADLIAEGPSASGALNTAAITKVFRLTNIQPHRAFLVDDVRVVAADLYQRLATPDFDPLSTAFVADPTLASMPNTEFIPATVEVMRDLPGDLEIRSRSTAPGLLIISEAYYPGWAATLNGQAVPVYEADGFAQAVRVPAGDSTLNLNYQPTPLLSGAIISILTLVTSFIILYGRKILRPFRHSFS